jgi:hypothetical protein
MSNSNFVNGLQDAIRQNPVSAALVGVGVLWMFAGGNRMSAAAALFPAAAKSMAGGAAEGFARSVAAGSSAAEGVRAAGARVVEGVRGSVAQAANAAGDAASRAYESVTETAADTADAAPDMMGKMRAQADTAAGLAGALQNNLKQTFQRQPLLLGAIGLAIGAGMAAAVPPTEMEKDFAGDAAAKVTTQVKEFASAQVDNVAAAADRTVEAVKDEIQAQGLTADAAKQGAAAIGDKLKSVAQAARGRSA